MFFHYDGVDCNRYFLLNIKDQSPGYSTARDYRHSRISTGFFIKLESLRDTPSIKPHFCRVCEGDSYELTVVLI